MLAKCDCKQMFFDAFVETRGTKKRFVLVPVGFQHNVCQDLNATLRDQAGGVGISMVS